jgi:hemerythrin HHE cation binding domain-containing protein
MIVTSRKAAGGAARAASAIVACHAELHQVLDEWAGVLAAAAARGGQVRPARNLLRALLADEVLPHTWGEVRTLYPAGKRDPRTGLLVRALVGEHRALASRAERLTAQAQPALSALFASHVVKENYLLLPALERSGAGLVALLARENQLAAAGERHGMPARRVGASLRPGRDHRESPGARRHLRVPGLPGTHRPRCLRAARRVHPRVGPAVRGRGGRRRHIECWLHGSRFDPATGRALSPPATRPVAVLGVRVNAGEVYVCLQQAAGPRGDAGAGIT